MVGMMSLTRSVETEPPFGGQLMDHRRGHRLADRADLEERVGSDRRTRVGIGEAEVEDRREAIGRRQAERQAGEAEKAAVRFAIGADCRKRRRRGPDGA